MYSLDGINSENVGGIASSFCLAHKTFAPDFTCFFHSVAICEAPSSYGQQYRVVLVCYATPPKLRGSIRSVLPFQLPHWHMTCLSRRPFASDGGSTWLACMLAASACRRGSSYVQSRLPSRMAAEPFTLRD